MELFSIYAETCNWKLGHLHFDLPLPSFPVGPKVLLTPFPFPCTDVGDSGLLYTGEWLHCLNISSRFPAAVAFGEGREQGTGPEEIFWKLKVEGIVSYRWRREACSKQLRLRNMLLSECLLNYN